jgi:hypothetical protein
MSSPFINAAPMVRNLGTKDSSTVTPAYEPEVRPQHFPFVYLFTKKGPEIASPVVGNSRDLVYGSDSFDLRQKWATHQTVLSNKLSAAANTHFIKRLKPADAKTATVRIYADVLATTLDNYERNSDGSIKKDVNGDPVKSTATPTVAGYSVKFIGVEIPLDEDGNSTFGQGAIIDGDQVDTTAGTQSKRYPLHDAEISSFGDWGNNSALRIYAPTLLSNTPIDGRLLTKEKVYPFRIAVTSRSTDMATPKLVSNINAEQSVDFVLKPDYINPYLDAQQYVGDVFPAAYQSIDPSSTNPPVYGDFGKFHTYDANIKTLLDLFVAAELPYVDAYSDLVAGDTDQAYRFNLYGGVSSQNSPYHTYQIKVTTDEEFKFSESMNLYAQGGSDGDMSDDNFAALVSADVINWADPAHDYQNLALYPVSDMYDTGFPMATKYDMISFIAARKDTFLTLACHDSTGPVLNLSQEESIAQSLLARVRNYPDSEYFGTPAVRASIIGRSGTLVDNTWTKELPLVIEIAVKRAKYMGASNGKWTNGQIYDIDPNNKVTLFKNINVPNAPGTTRNTEWDVGLNWVEPSDRRTFYFPALQTVYSDDTSILKSELIAHAICEVMKIGELAHRTFSGSVKLNNDQLIERVNKFVTEQCEGKFDDVIIVVPDCYFTQGDKDRGYSWTLRIKVYGPNMKTIETLYVEAFRLDDYQAAA